MTSARRVHSNETIPGLISWPQVMPTSAFPAVGFPPLPFGDGYRRLTYRIVLTLTHRLGSGPIHAWRRSQAGTRCPRPQR